MASWWVYSKEMYGSNARWHGPFDDSEKAERAALRLSRPGGAEEKFAELVHGKPGGKGTRMREFYWERSIPQE